MNPFMYEAYIFWLLFRRHSFSIPNDGLLSSFSSSGLHILFIATKYINFPAAFYVEFLFLAKCKHSYNEIYMIFLSRL